MDRRTRRVINQVAETLPEGWGDQLLERAGMTSRRQTTRTALTASSLALLVALIVAAAVRAMVAGHAADNVD